MATTEGTWNVMPTQFSRSVDIGGGIICHLTTSNTTYEPGGNIGSDGDELNYTDTWSIQKGAHALYILKEQLVQAGWQVVSSSYRTNYGNLNSFSAGSNLLTTYITGTLSSSLNKNFFTAVEGDGWLPVNGVTLASLDLNDKAALTDFAISYQESVPAHTVIYPGNTYSDASGLSGFNHVNYVDGNIIQSTTNASVFTDTRRGLYSRFYQVAANGNRTSIGRSWCLLRAPENFNEKTGARNREGGLLGSSSYHILLDYTTNHDVNPWWYTNNSNNLSSYTNTMYDTGSLFGATINIHVFPDYGDKYTNLKNLNNLEDGTYVPSPFIRPSHKFEISNMSRTIFVADAGEVDPNSTVNANYAFVRPTQDAVKSNFLYDLTYGSNIIFTSENTNISSIIALGTISDPLSYEITTTKTPSYYPGEKFFAFWSKLSRGRKIIGGKHYPNSDVAFTTNWEIWYYKTLAINQDIIKNSLFDSSEEYAFIQYYRKYKANSLYETSILNSCFPTFGVRSRRRTNNRTPATYENLRAPHAILVGGNMSGVTKDYTYVEWPLPLIDVISVGTTKSTTLPNYPNYTFAGRIMDIKLGPADGVNGILAKDPTEDVYDRILIDGLWFPYNGTSGLDF